MTFKYNSTFKTMGPTTTNFILGLYDSNMPLFNTKDALSITGMSVKNLNVFLGRLVKKGLVTRLKPGLFNLVPLELGREKTFLGNPYWVAKKIIEKKGYDESSYYISHGSAMEIHQVLTQPNFDVIVSTDKPIRKLNILGTDFNFVQCKSEYIFGIEEIWIEKTKKVRVSNLERTILDGLRNPDLCGGLGEVSKALWMKKSEIDIKKLVNYALALDINAVIKRLGFLLELYEFNCEEEVKLLNKKISHAYSLLDPGMFNEGKYLSRWKIRINIDPEELLAIVRT